MMLCVCVCVEKCDIDCVLLYCDVMMCDGKCECVCDGV